MGDEKITVNETCIVRQSECGVEINPHPDTSEWYARIELPAVEIEKGIVHMPAMTLRSVDPFIPSEADE